MSRKKHRGDGSRERGGKNLPLFLFISSTFFLPKDFELMYLGNKKMGFKKSTKKVPEENVKMEWKFRSRIPHSRPCFLLSQRSSIVSIVLLMTNIDCKIVVFFSIKIVFFAQSMQSERDKKF